MSLSQKDRRKAKRLWDAVLDEAGRARSAETWLHLVDQVEDAIEDCDTERLHNAVYNLYCRADDGLKSAERALESRLDAFEKFVPPESRHYEDRDSARLVPYDFAPYEEEEMEP